MGEVKKNIPKLRFKGYEDAWEQRKLGDIVLSEIKGSAKAEMIGGDTPYLETNYLNGGECLFVDSENNVDTDDVIILWDGSQAGTIYHGFTGALGSTFKAYKIACLGLFIFQQLKKNQQTIYDKYRTPNIPHVIKTFKDEYNIMLTSEREQNEIGSYFQQIDNLITLHQRKYDALKSMKKTLLSKMFPKNGEDVPEIRFKGFTDAWEQRKLGIDINVTSVKRVHQSDWETEGIPFYRARDIVSEFKGEEISEPIFVSKKTYEEFSRISGKVQADDLLVTGVGTIGVPYLVKSNNPLYFKDGNVIWIQNNKKLNGYFLFYTFITNPIQNFIRESAGTGTVGTLTIETCKRIPVFIPGKKEQISVGEFFQTLDNLITLHQRKLDELKNMKKTLLQQMFV